MIIALDLATKTGVAVGEPRGQPKAWTEDLGPGSGKLAEIMRLIDKLTRQYRPVLIAIEEPLMTKAGHANSVAHQHRLHGAAIGTALLKGVKVQSYPVSTIRKHFCGHLPKIRGNGKINVMNQCRALGWKFPDDNAADALALWDYACALQCAEHGTRTGLFAHGRTS